MCFSFSVAFATIINVAIDATRVVIIGEGPEVPIVRIKRGRGDRGGFHAPQSSGVNCITKIFQTVLEIVGFVEIRDAMNLHSAFKVKNAEFYLPYLFVQI